MKLEKHYHDLNREKLEWYEKCAEPLPEMRRCDEWARSVTAEGKQTPTAQALREADLWYRALTVLADRVAELNDMNVTMERISDLQAVAVLESDYVMLPRGDIRSLTQTLLKQAKEIELLARDGLVRLRLDFDLTR